MRAWVWALGLGIALATAGSIAARDSFPVSTGLAVLAVLGALGLLLGLLLPARRASAEAPPRLRYPQGQLERAFRSGDLGRQRVIEAVESVQTRVFPFPPHRLSPDEVRALQRASESEFRSWVSDRLDALEREV